MTIPYPALGPPIEDYAVSDTPGCDPTEKAGVVAFRAFILGAIGGRDYGIVRPCDKGGPSDHWNGRAWDYRLDASDPTDAQRAQDLIDWLTATDANGNKHAMLRRAGITFLIWNHQVWSTKMGMTWKPYTGVSPHTDHIHISFGWPGALAQTSLYRWLGTSPEARPGNGLPSVVPVAFEEPSGTVPSWLALVGGAAAGWFGYRWLRKAR